MRLMFCREWLSNSAKSEFARALPWRQRVARWGDQQKETLRTGRAFVTIVSVIVLLHIIIPLFPTMWASLPTPSTIRVFIGILWPVHAAIVSAIFVVVFFIIGAIYRAHPIDVVLSNVVRKMYLVPIAAFALSSIIGEGISSLLLLEKPVSGGFAFKGLQNLLVLDALLFFFTMIALLYCLWLTFKYVRSSEIWKLQTEVAQQIAKRAVEQQIISKKAEQIRSRVLEAAGLASFATPGNFEPLKTTKRGYVLDIELRAVKKFSRSISSKVEPTNMLGKPVYGSFRIDVGQKIDDEDCVVAYIPPEAASLPLIRVVDQALKVRASLSSGLDEFNQAFTDLYEKARESIKNGQRSTVREFLEFYKQALLSFLDTTHSHGITHDYCTGGLEIAFPSEWKVRDRIFEDVTELLLRSMATDDMTSYELMRYYPVDLIEIGMRLNDHVIFTEAIRCYTKMYRTLTTVELGRQKIYWQDLKEIWVEILGKMLSDMHYDARRLGDNPQKVTATIRFSQLLNRELFLFMMLSAERRDKDMCLALLSIFSETFNCFWDVRTKEFGDTEKAAKNSYDKERIIGIVALCGMLAFTHHNQGDWESIIEDCVEVLLHEFDAMPVDLSFTEVTNIGIELGVDSRDPQWFWDSLSYIEIPSWKETHGWAWIHFEDFVALGSIMALASLVENKQLTEKQFVHSLNKSAISPLQRALQQITTHGERWGKYLGGKGLKVAQLTLKDISQQTK